MKQFLALLILKIARFVLLKHYDPKSKFEISSDPAGILVDMVTLLVHGQGGLDVMSNRGGSEDDSSGRIQVASQWLPYKYDFADPSDAIPNSDSDQDGTNAGVNPPPEGSKNGTQTR
jgi:hypothetical protein